MADGNGVPVVTAEARRQRELAVLAWVQREHPDIWAMSLEVDWSLIEYMLELTADERLQASRGFQRLWEAGYGPSQDC